MGGSRDKAYCFFLNEMINFISWKTPLDAVRIEDLTRVVISYEIY